MKKTICLVLCLVMMMTLGVSVFALDIVRPGFDLTPQNVKDFKALVDAIGEVTLEDKAAIEAAEAACEELLNTLGETKLSLYKDFKNSKDTLAAARAAYDALAAAQTPSEPVDPAGDNTFMVIAMVVLSMTALVVLVSKKRAI